MFNLDKMIHISSKLPDTKESIFSEMTNLANKTGAVNLSQGFPDFDCDPKLIDMVSKEMKCGNNQYAPMPGVFALREVLAQKIENLYQAIYHPDTEITITAGGTQAIYTALACIINSGDEVIIFEPAYDCYSPAIKAVGGLVVPYELSAPDFCINWETVSSLITDKTKAIIINSPNNPTGKVFTHDDMQQLIKITENTNIILISDEVYEHIVFNGCKHISVAQYPLLKERSFVTASFGKLFHTTGWKIGYCLAPDYLMKEFRKLHQFMIFSVNTPIQHAFAVYLKDPNVYLQLSDFYQQKRDYFVSILKNTRFKILPVYGSYFQSVSYAAISEESDYAFAQRITKKFGVASIPNSAFYTNGTDHKTLRLCFAKKQETLDKAVDRLIKI